MSTDVTATTLAAVLDALTLIQGRLDTVARGNARIEAAQKDILSRLDTIDAGQAAVTDLVPVLETILARSIEDRELTRAQFTTVAEIAAFAHAAASGNSAPLPIDVADDALLERFALAQPADRTSEDRALVEWQKAARNVGSAELLALLARQYHPSPTDRPETRVLRYRLAAITRSEIEGRGLTPLAPPASTIAVDRSVSARNARSDELARLWRAGESAALFAEPELAGLLDIFAQAERSGGGDEDRLSADLADLHRALGERLAAGERPSIADARTRDTDEPTAEIQPDRQR
ncbi:hypothetical protein [Sphingomonas sp. Root720]|uniref:hypothetical protein n=1 Tax=Sphingomonas sp. Root720 TaxID=1736595 RepID=UPI0006FD223C|nr:hypothetical protein [Sphingomonas sp. Root720]KRB93220.1 hypothetical protein ASE22_25600 [Sphingomonas sp. Root720]